VDSVSWALLAERIAGRYAADGYLAARVDHVIRPEQVTEEYLRTRAHNYGRGQARLVRPAPGTPRLLGA